MISLLIRSLGCGGAEKQFQLLLAGLQKNGWPVQKALFYAGDDSGQGISLEKKGRWDLLRPLRKLIAVLSHARKAENGAGLSLKDTTGPIKRNILYSFLVDANIFGILAKPFVPGLKVVWGVRASNMVLEKYDRMARTNFWLSGRLARFADLIIANSESGRKFHISKGYPAEKTIVIPNGIDTHEFHSDSEMRARNRHEWGVKKAEILIGIVARFDPMKDYPTFLGAAQIVSKTHSARVRFICVGDGPPDYSRELQNSANLLGLKDRTIWTGLRSDMCEVYNTLDVLVSSSITEGFSNVVGEAMACGVHCVVTDVGDSKMIVADTGVAVPPGDPKALAEGIFTLLELKREERLGDPRKRIEEHFSLEQMIAKTEKALENIG